MVVSHLPFFIPPSIMSCNFLLYVALGKMTMDESLSRAVQQCQDSMLSFSVLTKFCLRICRCSEKNDKCMSGGNGRSFLSHRQGLRSLLDEPDIQFQLYCQFSCIYFCQQNYVDILMSVRLMFGTSQLSLRSFFWVLSIFFYLGFGFQKGHCQYDNGVKMILKLTEQNQQLYKQSFGEKND